MCTSEEPTSVSTRSLSGPRAAIRVISDRNFGPYILGNFLSASGLWMQTLAQSILIYRLTGSAFLLGLVNFAQFAGVIVLAPWAGPAADRFDRRRLLTIAQLGAAILAFVLAALAGTGHLTAAVLVSIVLGIGIMNGVGMPAMQALVPALVSRERVGIAVALNSATFNLARASGPACGAAVIAYLSVAWAFAIIAATYLALVAALACVRPRERIELRGRPRLRESVALLRRDRRLLGLMGIVATTAISVDPVTTLGPAFATQVFDRPDTFAGYLVGAFGIGAVIAALFVAGRPFRTPVAMAGRLLVLAAGILAFALSTNLAFTLLALLVAGAGFLMSNAAATTSLQLDLDDTHRGRIMALWGVAFLGTRPLASLIDGSIAAVAGVRVATLVLALPALAASIALLVFAFTKRRAANRARC